MGISSQSELFENLIFFIKINNGILCMFNKGNPTLSEYSLLEEIIAENFTVEFFKSFICYLS